MCRFRRKAANYADCVIPLWQFRQEKLACLNRAIMCVPFSADINVINTYNSDIIANLLEWCISTAPEMES